MKAAVLYPNGKMSRYVDIQEPIAENDDEIIVRVKAVAIKHLDKSRASGQHYSSEAPTGQGRIVGGDGICLLDDGTRVYAMGVSGMAAEKATIDRARVVKVPAGLDDITAAALPNAVIGSAMALRFKAEVQTGDVVLINGATSFTGRVAIQIAKHYGAKKVIVTGRNQTSLNDLKKLGADETVSVLLEDDRFVAEIKRIHQETPIDVIIDYLWGHTAEMLLGCFRGDGSFTNRLRYVSIGSITDDLIRLSAATLRSVDIQLSGSGMGSWSKEQVGLFFSEILPEIYDLAANKKISIEMISVELSDIDRIWDLEIPAGQRLVISIPH